MPFIPEKQSITIGELNIPQGSHGPFGKQPDAPGTFRKIQKRLPVFMVADVQFLPIVHATAFQMLVGELKPQRIDQMQHGIRVCAKPTDITRVLRYLRLEEDEVEHR